MEIKVRAWHELNKEMVYPKIGGLSSGNILNLFSPEFIMMGIGLPDKNGKEIYVGDLVQSSETGIIYQVSFEDGKIEGFHENYVFHYRKLSNGIVVGNIFENPEMLKR